MRARQTNQYQHTNIKFIAPLFFTIYIVIYKHISHIDRYFHRHRDNTNRNLFILLLSKHLYPSMAVFSYLFFK